MLELTTDEYERVGNLLHQKYRPKRERLAQPLNPLERFGEKEFSAGDVAELFHENTKMGPIKQREKDVLDPLLDSAGFRYFQSRAGRADYEERPLIELPEPSAPSAAIADVLLDRRSVRSYAERPITMAELSTVLRYGVGVSGEREIDVTDGQTLERHRRTYPSPGSLDPVELYLCVLDVDGLDDGVYFYSPVEHGLRELRTDFDDFEETVAGTLATLRPFSVETAGVYFVFAATFWRAKLKYGARGYRYALQESGHMAQNLLLAAEATGLAGVTLAAYRDVATNDLLDLDGVNRATIYSLLMGPKDD